MDYLRNLKWLCISLILNFFFIVDLIEGQSRGSKPGGKKGAAKSRNRKTGSSTKASGASYSTGLYVCLVALVLCFIPAIAVFFYNLYKDPMTPELVNRLFQAIKSNLTGQLSKKKNTAATKDFFEKEKRRGDIDNSININIDRNSESNFFVPPKAKRQ